MMRLSLGIFFGLCACLAMADTPEQRLAPLASQSLLETAGGLVLVLLLIIGGAWLFRRYGQLPMAGRQLVSVLGGVSVGPRERVVVVKVEGARLVVGVAPGQVRTLYVLSPAGKTEESFEAQLDAAVKRQDSGG